MRRGTLSALVALVSLLLLSTTARAQSTIAGVVKDSTGAVLPGVTVEAASDALIEKSKIGVTDGSGLYKIIDLRPGTYRISFVLTGFQTIKREGLELSGGFTATVDATMKVGALEESVTVSGASPVVDVQTNTKAQVIPRDVLDSVPNAHTIQSVGQLIPGISLNQPDVGGSYAMQQTYFSVHGAGSTGTSVLMDGMIINGLEGDGAIQSYMNDAASQEMVYQTGGGSGDNATGGVRINVVPKEGANRYSGSLFVGLENWQSDNFSDSLKSQGVTSVDAVGTYHDVDFTGGGPVKKDRLWFFGSGRLFTVKKPIASTTNSGAFAPNPVTGDVLINANASFAALQQCRTANNAVLGSCAQGVDDEVINSALGRLTLQVNSKNKLSAYMDRISKTRGAAMSAGDDQATTAIAWSSPLYVTDSVKWTSALSNRLLLEGGYSGTILRRTTRYVPGIDQPLYTALWYSMATRTNTTDGTRAVAGTGNAGGYPDRYNWQASASYVTGSHNFKVGFQDSYGPENQRNSHNADLAQQYETLNGVPNTAYQVTIYPTSPWWQDRLNASTGIYAQDSWTKKRLTVNVGLRWDYLSQQVTGQPIQQGTFAVIPAYGDIQMPTQKNWSPRVSVVYDLFGNGKTAVRAGFNGFPNQATVGLPISQDPASASITAALPWSDLNGDNIAQYQVTHNAQGQLVSTCTFGTAGCEINFATVPGNFGAVTLSNVIDPNLKRAYTNQVNLGISHELFRGVSVTVEGFYSQYKNIQTTQNLARLLPAGITDPALNPNYQPVTIFSPIDGHAVTVFDVASTAVASAVVTNTTYTDTDQTSSYKGLDVGFNARLPKGARLFGGFTTERTVANSCDLSVYNPNNINYCDTSNLTLYNQPGQASLPWKTQIKLSGSYPLPWGGVVISGSFQGLPGYTEGNTTYSVSKSTVYTTCPGNSAAAGCVVGQKIDGTMISSSISVPLDAAGTTLTPRVNQLALGIAKRLKFGRLRIDPKIDLFNVLNSDAFFSVKSTAFSPIVGPAGVSGPAVGALAAGTSFTSFRQPSSEVDGRLLRIGANVTW